MSSNPALVLPPVSRFGCALRSLASDSCLVIRDERGLPAGFISPGGVFSAIKPPNSYRVEMWDLIPGLDAQLEAYRAGIPAFDLISAPPAALAAYSARVFAILSAS